MFVFFLYLLQLEEYRAYVRVVGLKLIYSRRHVYNFSVFLLIVHAEAVGSRYLLGSRVFVRLVVNANLFLVEHLYVYLFRKIKLRKLSSSVATV